MPYLSKITEKFYLQKIINDVKSMIGSPHIPEANKNDHIPYCLSELDKQAKELAANHSKQADAIAKISTLLGTLYQEVMNSRKGKDSTPVATAEVTETKIDKT